MTKRITAAQAHRATNIARAKIQENLEPQLEEIFDAVEEATAKGLMYCDFPVAKFSIATRVLMEEYLAKLKYVVRRDDDTLSIKWD